MNLAEIAVIASIISSSAAFVSKPLVINNDQLINSWQNALAEFDVLAYPQRDFVIKTITDLHRSSIRNKLSKKCLQSLDTIKNGLVARRQFAYKLLDASAKGSGQLAFGYVSNLGSKHNCLSIVVNDEVVNSFTGQYCIAKISLPRSAATIKKNVVTDYMLLNISSRGTLLDRFAERYEYFASGNGFYAGLCVPSTCSPQEIDTIINNSINGSHIAVQLEGSCVTNAPPTFSIRSWCFILIMAGLASLASVCTVLDVYHEKTSPIVKAVSLRTSLGKCLAPSDGTHNLVTAQRLIFQLLSSCAHVQVPNVEVPSRFRKRVMFRLCC